MKTVKIHFENLWEEAEKLSSDPDIKNVILQIKSSLDQLESNPQEIGNILFLLANISKLTNVNVAAALLNKINDIKVDLYEE